MVRLERDQQALGLEIPFYFFWKEKENREEELNHVLSFCLPPSLMKNTNGMEPRPSIHSNLGSARRLLVVSLPCVLAEVSSSRPEA